MGAVICFRSDIRRELSQQLPAASSPRFDSSLQRMRSWLRLRTRITQSCPNRLGKLLAIDLLAKLDALCLGLPHGFCDPGT